MKLRIKVKHLVVALLTVCGLFVVVTNVVIPKARTYMAEKQFQQGGLTAKADILKAIDGAASNKEKWRLIRQYMIETGVESAAYGFNVVIGPGTSYSQSSTSMPGAPVWQWEEKLPYVQIYAAEAPADGYAIRASRQLALYYGSQGQREEAIAALERMENRLNADYANQREELKFERAKLYADSGDFTQAETLIREVTERFQQRGGSNYLNARIAKLRADIYVRQGKAKAAYEEVARELEIYKQAVEADRKKFPDAPGTPILLEQLEMLKNNLMQYNGHEPLSTVSGTVTRSDGTPLVGVGVYLRHRDVVNRSVVDDEPYQTLTDADGRYRFEGVLPDSYQLYIGLYFEQIDGWTWPLKNDDWIDVEGGKQLTENVTLRPLMNIISPIDQEVLTGRTVAFKWEPVAGASFYTLTLNMPVGNGTTIGTMLRAHIRDSFVEVPVEELYDHKSGISYKHVGDKEVPNPVSLLGFANPEVRYFWSVEAFDDNGRPMTRSNGYRLNEETIGALPFFYLKQRGLSPADRLLLDDKQAEALAAYKSAYEADGDDRHSLRMIVRIYEARASEARAGSLSDEVLPYLLRLAELNPAGPYAFDVFYDYYKKKDWERAEHYYAEKIAAGKERVEPYEQSIYATVLLRQGRFAEAAKQFREALARDDSHRYVGSYLAAELYVSGDFDAAIALAGKYPERSFGENGPVWSRLLERLAAESASSDSPDAYRQELKLQLERYFADDREALGKWSASASAQIGGMKTFLNALLAVD